MHKGNRIMCLLIHIEDCMEASGYSYTTWTCHWLDHSPKATRCLQLSSGLSRVRVYVVYIWPFKDNVIEQYISGHAADHLLLYLVSRIRWTWCSALWLSYRWNKTFSNTNIYFWGGKNLIRCQNKKLKYFDVSLGLEKYHNVFSRCV